MLPIAVCGGIFLAVTLLIVALIPIARERREARWQAYVVQCERTGFSKPQCRLLFNATEQAGDDNDLATALAASSLAQSLLQQQSR